MKLRLATRQTITLQQASGAALLRLSAPFTVLATNPPTESAAQDVVVAELAQALAPFVTEMDAPQLCDHFSAYPTDMVQIAARVMGSKKYTGRGKQKRP